MATGKAAQMPDALLARVNTLVTGSPTLPVSMPEVAFDPPADGKYLAVSFFPNKPRWEGLRAGVLDQGLLQISVVWPKGGGVIAPSEVAETIKIHFAKATVMVSGSTKVTVTGQPWAAQPIIEPDRLSIPVTIPWSA